MSSPDITTEIHSRRPQRADARRNYEKVLAAAREVFAEEGTAAPLDDIARRADVGIATLYRHFPTRQHLLEAVYVDEFEAISRRAEELASLPPWDALEEWLREYVAYAATKKALAQEMLTYIELDAEVFRASKTALQRAGGMLLQRAQDAGEVRPDTTFRDVGCLVGSIAGIRGADPDDIERTLRIVLDGLRYQPPPA
jgi:AcrR family transcriptional regulator